MNSEDYLLVAEAIQMLKDELKENPQELTFELVERALVEAFRENDPDFDYVLFLNDCELTEAEDNE
jgi:DNA replication protein DnaD